MAEKSKLKEQITLASVVILLIVLFLSVMGRLLHKSLDVNAYPSNLSVIPMAMTTDFINNYDTERLSNCVRIGGSAFTLFVPEDADVTTEYIKGKQNDVFYIVDTFPTEELREAELREQAFRTVFGNAVMSVPFSKTGCAEELTKEGYLGQYKAAYVIYSIRAKVSVRTEDFTMFSYIVPISATDSVVIATIGGSGELDKASQLLYDMGASVRGYNEAFSGINDSISQQLGDETEAQDAFSESVSEESHEKESESVIESTEKEEEKPSRTEKLVEIEENINISGGGELAYLMITWEGGVYPSELHLYYPETGEETMFMEEYSKEGTYCFGLTEFAPGIFKLRGLCEVDLPKPTVKIYDYMDFYDLYMSGEE